MRFFPVFNHWLHLISVIFWIGGVAFQVLILTPLLQTGGPSYPFLKKMSLRFRSLVGPLLLVLVITGGINLHFRRAGIAELPPGYISALGIKIFLVSIIASLYFFDMLQSRQEGQKDPSNAVLPGEIYTKLILAIGVVIIFLAAMLRQWRF